MFGLTFDKIFVLLLIAFFLIGPQKMPYYASQLARLVKGARQLTVDARERIRDELGPEYDEIDWKKLDPRQYDPRAIIREALLDTPEPARSAEPRPTTAATAEVPDVAPAPPAQKA